MGTVVSRAHIDKVESIIKPRNTLRFSNMLELILPNNCESLSPSAVSYCNKAAGAISGKRLCRLLLPSVFLPLLLHHCARCNRQDSGE